MIVSKRLGRLWWLLVAMAGFVATSAGARESDLLVPPPAAGEPPAVLADGPLTFDTNLGLIERATLQAVEEALEGITLEPGSDILLHPLTSNEGAWFVEDCMARLLSQRGYRVHLTEIEPPAAPSTTPPSTKPPAGGGAKADSAAAAGPSIGDLVRGTAGAARGDSAAAPSDSTAKRGSADPGAPTSTTPGGGKPHGDKFKEMMDKANAQKGVTPPAEPAKLNPIPPDAGLVLTYRIVEFGVTYHDSWRRGFLGQRVVERLAAVDLYTRLVKGSAKNVLWAGRGRAERLDVVPNSKLDLLEGRTYPFTPPKLQSRPLSRLAEPVLVSGIITGLVFLFYSSQN